MYTKEASRSVDEKLKGKDKSHQMLQFMANSLMVNTECSLLFTGDLAFFKPGDAQFADANKRSGLAESPGTKPCVAPKASKPTFKVSFIQSRKLASTLAPMFNDVLGTDKSGFNELDDTDGQGICTLDRYLDLLKGQGPISDSLLKTIEELKKPVEEINWDNVTEKLQPVKGFVHGLRFDPEFGRVMPKNLKYSLLPIYPAVLGNDTLKKLYSKMVDSGTDEACFTTTSKLGTYNVNTLEQEGKFLTTEFSNEDYRIPQVVNYKDDTEQNAGSQIRKQIQGNVELDGYFDVKYKETQITGKELLENYESAWSLNIEEGHKNLRESLEDENGNVSIEKVADKVKKALTESAYTSVPTHIIDALQVETLPDGTKQTSIPLSFPTIKTRVESTLYSMYRREVTKKDMPGFVGIQYSSLGYDVTKDSIKTDRSLLYTRIDEKTGKVLPAEVICSPVYFIECLKNMPQTPKITEAIEKLKNGTFDVSDLKGGLDEVVIYRIPYQGLSSSVPCKIVGFTPEAAGTTITVPMEMTAQAGIDFDIDKVYVEIKHFEDVVGKFHPLKSNLSSREGRNNLIIDTHYAILTSPNHFKEMITENNCDTLNALAKKYESKKDKGLWGAVSTQEDLRDVAKDGKIFIGISANAAAAHSIIGRIGMKQSSKLGGDITINDKTYGVLEFGKKHNNQGGLISDDFGQLMTTSVDNVKNPVLGILNINTVTGPTLMWLVENGTGLEYAIDLINTPIVKEFVTEVRTLEQSLSKYEAFNKAQENISKRHDIIIDPKTDYNVTHATLKDLQNTGNSIKAKDAFRAFITFNNYAQDFGKACTAIKIDVNGAKQSTAENLMLAKKLASLAGTYASELYFTGKNPTVSINQEMYRKHSLSAYEKHGILGALDTASQILLDGTQAFTDVANDFESLATRITAKDMRTLFTDLYTKLAINEDVVKNNPILAWLDSDSAIDDVLYGENSLGNRLLKRREAELQKQNRNPAYVPNKFVMALTVELDKNREMVDVVSFNNSISRALTKDQKDEYVEEFLKLADPETALKLYRDLPQELRTKSEEEIEDEANELFNNLILYPLITEGFSRTINSYSEFIPSSVYKLGIVDNEGRSMVDHFREMEKQITTLNPAVEVQFLDSL